VGIVAAGIMNFDYFWFLNADAVVEKSALVELIGRAEKQADIGMVGSVVRYYDSPDVIQALGGSRLDTSNGNSRHIGEGSRISKMPADGSVVERELTYLMGASMLVSQRYIIEIGLMQEDYFLYFEDADWCMRGSEKFKLGFSPKSHIFHKWGVNSHKSASHTSVTYYYRNRLRFVARFLPSRLAAAKRAMFEQLLRHVARGRWPQATIVLSTLLSSREITQGVSKIREDYQ
jgi:GT2 family glycosyltransferase